MKKNKYKLIISFLFLLAFILRLIYVIKTPYTENQHDIGNINNSGGINYIFTIFCTGHLPSDNYGQHYHPPLHFFICAIFLKIINLFNNNITFLCESLQFLTLLYSMLLLLITYFIFKELHIQKNNIILGLLFCTLNPTLIILSGSINNDLLCLTLIMWTILRLIKWDKKVNIKNTIILALATGLCVMTKLTGAIIAVPIIYIFATRFSRELWKNKQYLKTLKKFLLIFFIFGIISLTIGMWYSIRNIILFNQPLLGIPVPNLPNLNDYSFLERFSPFSYEFFQIYCNPNTDHNNTIYLIKNSLFGEFTWKNIKFLYYTSIICNIILIISTIIIFCIILIKKIKLYKKWIIMFSSVLIYNFLLYYGLNLSLPYACSMDFRYLGITIFCVPIFWIYFIQSIKNKKVQKVMYYTLIILFSITFICSNLLILL